MEMWDDFDDFESLPEEEPGLEFREVVEKSTVLNKDLVRSKLTEEVQVNSRVVDVLSAAPDEVLPVLGVNALVRQPQVEKRWYEIKDGVLCVEGGSFHVDMKSIVGWAEKNNTSLFRDLVFDNYEEYLREAERADVFEALLWYRRLRSVTPTLNVVSKKLTVMEAGLSTLGKIRDLLSYGASLAGTTSTVAFGIGGPHHAMAYHPNVVLCVDTDSRCEGADRNYFVKGNLLDWKKYVQAGDMILSDCSLGDSDMLGLEIPNGYYEVYKEMCKAGHYVLCKINKFGVPYRDNWSVASIGYYREHNMEAFVLLSPKISENVYRMRDLDIEARMRQANDSRMRWILGRRFDTEGVVLRYTEDELLKALGLSKLIYRWGEKNYSVVRDIFVNHSEKLDRTWKALCYDGNYSLVEFCDYLDVNFEYPCILMDMQYLAADKERLFASFHAQCVMEFWDEIGWVAVERKIDK